MGLEPDRGAAPHLGRGTMTRPLLLLLCGLAVVALAGCTTIPEQVNVRIPVACIDPADLPQKPDVRSEADLLNMPRGLRTIATWADLWKLHIYAAELEALVEGCARIPRT